MSSTIITDRDPIRWHDQNPSRHTDPALARAWAAERAAWDEHSRITDLWMDGKACRAQVVQAELVAIATGNEVTRIYVGQNHAGSVAVVREMAGAL